MTPNNAEKGAAAQPARVLIVEDEFLVRMLIDDMLQALGYTVAAETARIEEAMQAATAGELDIAILDVNVNGENAAPVAEALAQRGIPFIFVTGYGTQGLPEGYRDRPILKKPFRMEELERRLSAALDSFPRKD